MQWQIRNLVLPRYAAAAFAANPSAALPAGAASSAAAMLYRVVEPERCPTVAAASEGSCIATSTLCSLAQHQRCHAMLARQAMVPLPLPPQAGHASWAALFAKQ